MTQINRLMKWLDKLVRSCFHGKVTLTFERGRLIHVRKEQAYKADEI